MTPKQWTKEEDAELKRLYPSKTAGEIAAIMGRTKAAIKCRRTILGLSKTENKGRFVKDQDAWNKGLTYNPGGRCAETQFKPGHLGGRARDVMKPIGTERITKDGYLQRKVNNDMPFHHRLKFVHTIIWEAEHGCIPRGYALVFKDGNKRNITLENLQLVSRAELMERNTLHQYGPEIAKTIQLQGQITRQINKRMRNQS